MGESGESGRQLEINANIIGFASCLLAGTSASLSVPSGSDIIVEKTHLQA